MTLETREALVASGTAYVAGKSMSRKETVELVRKLLQELDKQSPTPPAPEPIWVATKEDPDKIPVRIQDQDKHEPVKWEAIANAMSAAVPAAEVLPPCNVQIQRLHDSSLLVGADANKIYNRREALALAKKITTVADSLK